MRVMLHRSRRFSTWLPFLVDLPHVLLLIWVEWSLLLLLYFLFVECWSFLTVLWYCSLLIFLLLCLCFFALLQWLLKLLLQWIISIILNWLSILLLFTRLISFSNINILYRRFNRLSVWFRIQKDFRWRCSFIWWFRLFLWIVIILNMINNCFLFLVLLILVIFFLNKQFFLFLLMLCLLNEHFLRLLFCIWFTLLFHLLAIFWLILLYFLLIFVLVILLIIRFFIIHLWFLILAFFLLLHFSICHLFSFLLTFSNLCALFNMFLFINVDILNVWHFVHILLLLCWLWTIDELNFFFVKVLKVWPCSFAFILLQCLCLSWLFFNHYPRLSFYLFLCLWL